MKAWKYVGRGKVLLLATKDDFTGVPETIVAATKGVVGHPWADRAGNPPDEHLIGGDRSVIEAASKTRGWYAH